MTSRVWKLFLALNNMMFLVVLAAFLKHIAADSRTDGSSCFKQLGHAEDRREFGNGLSCSLQYCL